MDVAARDDDEDDIVPEFTLLVVFILLSPLQCDSVSFCVINSCTTMTLVDVDDDVFVVDEDVGMIVRSAIHPRR